MVRFSSIACAIATLLASPLSASAAEKKLPKPVSSECTILAIMGLRIPGDTTMDEGSELTFECELDPSDANGISGISAPLRLDAGQKKYLKEQLESGDLVSGESTLEFADDTMLIDNEIYIPSGKPLSLNNNNEERGRRRLAVVQGRKPILVVKVTDNGGLKRTESPAQIGDDIFGTLGDPVNLRSQMAACSMNTLDIVPGDPPAGKAQHFVAPGVIEVTINVSLTNSGRSAVRSAVTTAVQAKLGVTLPGPYQQVIYVLEKCYVQCGWAAYAYINSWNSVYQGDYYKYTGVLIHEIGHNFNLAHSGGLNNSAYTDHTCMMGNPLYSDDVGKMCYNPAKNWQMAWYGGQGTTSSHKVEIDPTNGSFAGWSGTFVGIADFDNNPQNHPVVLKLETGTALDYFIGFNRATGANSENDEGDDQVTLIQVTSRNGVGYSQSYLRARMSQAGTHVLENFHDGKDLTIKVDEINIAANPGYARVTVSVVGAPTNPPSTMAPTASPIITPTVSPSPTQSPVKASPSPSRSPVSGPKLADNWMGIYVTETRWWGTYFSPLQIHSNNTITIRGGSSLTYSYESGTEKVTIDIQVWDPAVSRDKDDTELQGKFWGAELTFSGSNADKKFDGRMKPRPQDGFVPFDGTLSETGPTSSPTTSPTRAPNPSPSSKPTRSPTSAPNAVPTTRAPQIGDGGPCQDTFKRFAFGDRLKNCRWAGRNTDRCLNEGVTDECPVTCGVNCTPFDTIGTFKYQGRNRKCRWVGKQPELRCKKNKLRSSCPVTCKGHTYP